MTHTVFSRARTAKEHSELLAWSMRGAVQALGGAVLAALGTAALLPSAHAGVTIGANFTADDRSSIGINFAPPDTGGAVGPSHVVEFINERYSVFDKTGTRIGSGISDAQFWQNAGISSSITGTGLSDTRMVYDPHSQHWFATEITINGETDNLFLVAVSNDSDPTHGWKATSFAATGGPTLGLFADFPQLGINRDGVYIAANMFNPGDGYTGYQNFLALDKTALINKVLNNIGSLPAGVQQSAWWADVGFTSHPAMDLDGSSPVNAAVAATWASVDGGLSDDGDHVRISKIDNSGAAPTFVGSSFIGVAGFPPEARQPGGGAPRIDAGDWRQSSAPKMVNGELWEVQEIQGPNSGGAAIRWARIGNPLTAPTVIDSGIIEGGALGLPDDIYMPSIAVNGARDVVIGFTGSDTTHSPSAYAVVGTTAGATTTFGQAILLKQGSGTYSQFANQLGYERWGDYSTTFVDPADSSSFWTFQEYLNNAPGATDKNWAVQITQLRVERVPEASSTLALLGGGLIVVAGVGRRLGRRVV